jgi:hypothetical protein
MSQVNTPHEGPWALWLHPDLECNSGDALRPWLPRVTLAQATALAELIWGSDDKALSEDTGKLYKVMASLMLLEDPDMVEDGWQCAIHPVGEPATLTNFAYMWEDRGNGFEWLTREQMMLGDNPFAGRVLSE